MEWFKQVFWGENLSLTYLAYKFFSHYLEKNQHRIIFPRVRKNVLTTSETRLLRTYLFFKS